jgi:integrase
VVVTPRDICRFLIWKDKGGKTPVHSTDCPQIGVRLPDCNCPRRLALGTVSCLVGQLRGIFSDMGKGACWDEVTQSGNPANSLLVKAYTKAIRQEQSKAHVQPKQAIPLFIDKLEAVCGYIDRQIDESGQKPSYTLLRDQAFFKLQFFAGDRAGDLGRMLAQEVKVVPSGALLITHTWGKTARVDKPNAFLVHPCKREALCPVRALQKYVEGASSINIDLSRGFLFRLVGSSGDVINEPCSYAAIYDRLKFYLRLLNLDEGETPHSFRGGCAITLVEGSGQSLEQIKDHVGWAASKTAEYYTRRQGSSAVSQEMANLLGGPRAYQAASAFRSHSGDSNLMKAFP